MTEQELMAFIKKSLRVASDTFDDEIQALIKSAEADITQATDKAFDITDSVQCNAIAVYCQAYFGYGDDKALARYKDMLIQIGLRKIGDEA
jgi:hypothetical protein